MSGPDGAQRGNRGKEIAEPGGPEARRPNVGDSALGVAQIVNTLTQYPGVARVQFEQTAPPWESRTGDGTITKSPVTPSDYPAAG